VSGDGFLTCPVYTFDSAGNRESESVTQSGKTTNTTYEYNEQNRLTKSVCEIPDGV